jgi:hypothetical protein
MYIWGGQGYQDTCDDTMWVLDLLLVMWRRVETFISPELPLSVLGPITKPCPRFGQSTTVLPDAGVLLVMGGVDKFPFGTTLNDLYSFNFHTHTWNRLLTPHEGVFLDRSVQRQRLDEGKKTTAGAVLASSSPYLAASPVTSPSPGGRSVGAQPSTTRVLVTPPAPNHPLPRRLHTISVDPESGVCVLFGGWDGTRATNSTFTLELLPFTLKELVRDFIQSHYQDFLPSCPHVSREKKREGESEM